MGKLNAHNILIYKYSNFMKILQFFFGYLKK